MAGTSVGSSEVTLTLTEEERRELLLVLEQALHDKQIEVHRTEAFAARELVQRQQTVLEGLVARLRRP
jgi:hypothetical protein